MAIGKGTGERWIDPRFHPLEATRGGRFIRLSDGRLLIQEGNATFTSSDDGKTWSDPTPIVLQPDGTPAPPGSGVPHHEGRLLCTRDGTILLVWMDQRTLNWDDTTGEPGPDAIGRHWSIRSTDGGRTWIDRQVLDDGIGGHPPLNFIQTAGGRIVVTVQFYLRRPGRNVVRAYTSADDGVTWRGSNIIDLGGHGHHDGAFEPTFTELKDGRLWMLIRTNWDRFWEAISDDAGLSWRIIRPSTIEASTSPGYLERLANGRLALVWNRLYPEGKDAYLRRAEQYSEAMASWHREELSIAFSEDEGQSWSQPVKIVREPEAWISYPYLFEVKPGFLWLTTIQGDLRVQFREADL